MVSIRFVIQVVLSWCIWIFSLKDSTSRLFRLVRLEKIVAGSRDILFV